MGKVDFAAIDSEQLPVAEHARHNWPRFAGLYAAEHVAATEFVIGATFVALGATTGDILLGLLIGNILAVLSWTLICAPIAVDTRLSLYTYLGKISGRRMSNLYNWANVLIFTVISAAMITVAATGVRYVFGIPAQLSWFPTDPWFVLIVLAMGMIAVFVAIFGFKAVSNFSGIAAPWLFTMFATGVLVLLPELSMHVLDKPLPQGWSDILAIGDQSVWTGTNAEGEPGIGLFEVIGFAWAANTITHFGLIDMILFRYAKSSRAGLASATGMMFGHFFAWIAAGFMGAATAVFVGKSIVELDPGDVAFHALGWSGFVVVLVAGLTTAITNLYRAGMAAQAVFPASSGRKTTLLVGSAMAVVACFPFVFGQILPLLTYAGLLVVPVGAIVFAEHVIFPRIGFQRLWCKFQNYRGSGAAISSWGVGLLFGFGLNMADIIPFYYLFLPTWAVTIGCYTILAGRMGAKNCFDAEQEEEAEYHRQLAAFQADQINKETASPMRSSPTVTHLIRIAALAALGGIIVLAFHALLGAQDNSDYLAKRELFYDYGFVCTLIYFALAIWAYLRANRSGSEPS